MAVVKRGHVIYDAERGHVCTCTEREHVIHPRNADAYFRVDYAPTVAVDRSVEPTESGSWFYRCSRCGASAWSGA